MKKKKILVLSDHPLSPSGVVHKQNMIEALLKTGRYQVICLGGAIRHEKYDPQTVEPYGEDWKIFPVMVTEIMKLSDRSYTKSVQICFGL